MIVQFSTGGRGGIRASAAAPWHWSRRWPRSRRIRELSSIVYENHTNLVEEMAAKMKEFSIRPEIEIFDLSHLHGARRLAEKGLLDEQPHIQFVMGVKNALAAEEHLLDILLKEAKHLFPACTWTAAGIGRHQSKVMDWALIRGADAVRTGLEEDIRITRERLASSNAELVEHTVLAIERHGHRIATPEEAHALLGCRPVAVP